jgi:hypothetical protein
LASIGLVARNQSARIEGQDTRIEAIEEDLDSHKNHAFDTYMPRKEHEVGTQAILKELAVNSEAIKECTKAINTMNSRHRESD